MAELVMAIGTSHSPLLTLPGERWQERAADDFRNPRLNLSDGRWVSYQQLADEVGDRFAAHATTERFIAKAALCQAALDRLAAELAAAAPDLVLIVGDDQDELFDLGNMPALSIFYGAEIVTRRREIGPTSPSWLATVTRGYAMDQAHVFAGAPGFALELIHGLIERQVDVAAAASIDRARNAGFGHAYGFVIRRLLGERPLPVVPLLLNTYYPPNVPTPARCHEIGRLLRQVIDTSPTPARVALIASGGLSHFVVDEQLDRRVIAALRAGDSDALRTLPRAALNAGSSEILNWITLAGALEGLRNRWLDYHPLYRTPAGTGIGVAFAVWS